MADPITGAIVGNVAGPIFDKLWGVVYSNKAAVNELAKNLEDVSQKIDRDVHELRSHPENSLQSKDRDQVIDRLRQDIRNRDQVIDRLRQDISGFQEQAISIGNNIRLPKDLELSLVRADVMHRLDEYRSQEGPLFLMLGLFGGAALAIIVNWITSTENIKTEASVYMFWVLIALVVYFAYRAFEMSRKVNKLKNKIFNDEVI